MHAHVRALLAMAVTIGGFAAVSLGNAPAAVAASPQDTAVAAVQAAGARGERAAVAVYDRHTGAFYAAGDADSFYASASLVKVAIAGQLLVTGQMGAVEGTAWDMIVRSSDSAANALYGRVGGDSVMNAFADRYGLGGYFAPPAMRGWWGITNVTARGMVLLYAAIANDPVVGPWLMNAMANTQCAGADGYPQCFGIPSATSGWRVKQGWMANAPSDSAGYIHSTGYVGGDRYAVALLTSGAPSIYGQYGRDTSTIMAQTLMPGGRMPDPASHNPTGRDFESARVDGATVTLAGWVFDPDDRSASIGVHVYEGGTGIGAWSTDVYRPDVNAAIGGSGNHGFEIRFQAPDGVHTYCAYAINIGPGTGNPQFACATVEVRAGVIGHADVAEASGEKVRLYGWAYDATEPAESVALHLYEGPVGAPGSRFVGVFAADLPSPDILANLGVAGDHRFDIQFDADSQGPRQYCLYGLNLGAGETNNLVDGRCYEVTVDGAPLGNLDSARGSELGDHVRFAGWVADRSDPGTSTDVHVWDFTDPAAPYPVGAYRAADPSPDVLAVMGIPGAHRFDFTVAGLSPGAHRLCLFGINIGAPADNSQLGCATAVFAGAPTGSVDSIATSSDGAARLRGWALDPTDPHAQIEVHVYTGGGAGAAGSAWGGQFVADQYRPDVAAYFGLTGGRANLHGFDVTVRHGSSPQTHCVYAINIGAPADNTLLGCVAA
jgi:hypothetical protein